MPRSKKKIDYTIFAFPKNPPDRSEAYKEYVRSLVCAAWSTECDGVTEPAHIVTDGTSQKASDYFAVPLCTAHHKLQHNLGVLTFMANEQVDLWRVAAETLASWIRRGCE